MPAIKLKLTAPGSALNSAVPKFSSNLYNGTRWAIDISSDGNQSGVSARSARDAALASGVNTINAITIGQECAGLGECVGATPLTTQIKLLL